MNQINKITPDNVAQLTAGQLVELLRVLLYSEARQRGIAQPGVHVPLQINIADGGEDGRWKADLVVSDFIPNKFTVYQCKAEDIGPTACQDEILTNRDNTAKDPLLLKSQVKEVLDGNGCYCFFCHKSYVKKGIEERLEKAREALKNAGRTTWDKDQLAFLDGNLIATWVNNHAAAIAFVSQACRITQPVTLTNWPTWAKYVQNNAMPFQKNSYLDERIKTLRDSLVKPKAIARVVGQSGLGKSRLAFEVFRPIEFADGSPKNTSLTDSMVFFDFEDATLDKLETIRQLAYQGVSGIIVADNCDRTAHDKLADLVRMEGSNLSLLTLDYEPETISAGFVHLTLEPEPLRELIPRLLQNVPAAMKLSSPQRDYIASFCQGFPQIAFLLVNSGAPLSFETLDERNFAKKLLWGREDEDPTDLRVIQTLSLFRHVGAEGDKASQLRFLCVAFCNGMEERDFRERCRKFQKLRVIQKAGDFWMVAPRPLAVALAAEWWESASGVEIMRLLPDIESAGLMTPFCNQLRLLNFSQKAQTITADLCGPTGPFGDAEALFSPSGSRLFRALVELNPAASLKALQFAFESKSPDDLQKLTVPRRNLVWALEKLCWESALFPTSARLLLRLAVSENENCANNATGQFKQLFQLYLSGTETPALKRLEVLEISLGADDPKVQPVCISALGVALMSFEGRFARAGGVEIRGSNLPRQDWSPSTLEEAAEYQFKAFRMLRDVAVGDGSFSSLARTEIGNHFGGLVKGANFTRLVPEIDELITKLKGYWPEARRSIDNLLQYATEGLPKPTSEQLLQWLPRLQPDDLGLKLRQIVTEAGYRHSKGADGHYVDVAAQEAEQLGRELGIHEQEWLPFLRNLQSGKQDKAYQFGMGIASTHPTPEQLLQTCLTSLKGIPVSERNASFVGGILRKLNDLAGTDAILEQVANDDGLIDLLVRLTVLKLLTRKDVERVVTAIEAGKIQLQELRQLCYGSVTDSLSAKELIEVLVPLTTRMPDALLPVYEILAMYTFNDAQRQQECKAVLRSLIMTENFVQVVQGSSHEHQWGDQCKVFLNETGSEEFAVNQVRQLVRMQISEDFRYRGGPDKQKVLSLLMEKHGNICWPIVGEALLQKDYYHIQDLIRANDNYVAVDPERADHEVYTCSIWGLDKTVLVSWCKEHPETTERLLEVIGLFTTDRNGSFHWHPLALAILEECYNSEHESDVESNLSCFGSTGSRVPYLQRRIDLVNLLETNPRPLLKELAQNLSSHFREAQQRERKSDEEFSAGIY